MFTRTLTTCVILLALTTATQATSIQAAGYNPIGTRWIFPQGFCTWFAAVEFNKGSDRIVDFGGNAGEWVANAEAQNWKVSRNLYDAAPGAIICWTGGQFGHVGIVRQVVGENVVVEEMNGGTSLVNAAYGVTNEFNKPTTRTFNVSRRLAKGNLKFAGFIFPTTAPQLAAR